MSRRFRRRRTSLVVANDRRPDQLCLVWDVLPVSTGKSTSILSSTNRFQSTHVEKLYIGEACWAFIFGIIIGTPPPPLFFLLLGLTVPPGPYGVNIFNPRSLGGASEETTMLITLEFTRIVLGIGVFAIGVELPKAFMRRHWKSLFFFLVPIMTWVRLTVHFSLFSPQ